MPRQVPQHARRWRLRAPCRDDAPAVFELILARDVADLGFADFTLEDLEDEWSRSAFELGSDAVVCEDADGRITGYAAIQRVRTVAAVDPGREGWGVGTALLDWVERRERELGRDHHRQGVASTSTAAVRLLRGRGYRPERSYWRMARALDALPEAPAPAGVRICELRLPEDARAVYYIDKESFAESPDYVPMSFTSFREVHLLGNDFAPELSIVASHEGRRIGFLLARRWCGERVGFVDVLAVCQHQQNRGIGTSLLTNAFAKFSADGLREAQLGVASSNPLALKLYESLGMNARFRIDAYARAAHSPDPLGEG